ncbi:MAG: DUF3473 domain-containing protein [Gammaproteobacteria bacterium]|nr:MAG: DUF3473 domain-containing protein [Gammaproteobacteria bacterium]
MGAGPGSLRNALTVDVEDYFHVSAFEGRIRPEEWDRWPSRVAANTARILDLLAARGVRATFFVLGWVAERHPELVRRIAAAGHEVASHGYAHRRVSTQDRAAFRADVTRAKALLEDLTGRAVQGYRAPSYSIGPGNLWALEELQEAGYRYSSSIYPIRHDLYGWPDGPRFPWRPLGEDGLLEIPITTVELRGRRLPCGGGGYFRLLPYGLYRWALERVNGRDRRPGVFYFHPWELDPAQPRPKGLGPKARFRHYLNLHRMEERLRRLLRDFRWGRMDEVFLEGAALQDGTPGGAPEAAHA